MKTTMIGLMLFGCIGFSSAQTAGTKPVPPKQTVQQTKSFEDFVNEHALTLVKNEGKEAPVVKAEIPKQKNLLLSEYKLEVLENEGQYYKIQGENLYLKVASMYRLRVMFESQNNIK